MAFQCHLCPGSTRSLLLQRLHLHSHTSADCRRCERRFGHRHRLLLHRLSSRCPKPLVFREALAAEALRGPLRRRLRDLRRETREKGSAADSAGRRLELEEAPGASEWGGSPSESSDTCEASPEGPQERVKVGSKPQKSSWQMLKDRLSSAGELRCHKCGRSFTVINGFQEHLRVSKSCGYNANRYKCPDCDATFAVLSEVAKHRKSAVACDRNNRRKELNKLIAQSFSKTETKIKPEKHSFEAKPNLSLTDSSSEQPQGPPPQPKNKPSRRAEVRQSAEPAKPALRCHKCRASFTQAAHLRRHLASPKACAVHLNKLQILRTIDQAAAQPQKPQMTSLVADQPKEPAVPSEEPLSVKAPISKSPKKEVSEVRSVTSVFKAASEPAAKTSAQNKPVDKTDAQKGEHHCPKCQAAFKNASHCRRHVNGVNACEVYWRNRRPAQSFAQSKSEPAEEEEPELIDLSSIQAPGPAPETPSSAVAPVHYVKTSSRDAVKTPSHAPAEVLPLRSAAKTPSQRAPSEAKLLPGLPATSSSPKLLSSFTMTPPATPVAAAALVAKPAPRVPASKRALPAASEVEPAEKCLKAASGKPSVEKSLKAVDAQAKPAAEAVKPVDKASEPKAQPPKPLPKVALPVGTKKELLRCPNCAYASYLPSMVADHCKRKTSCRSHSRRVQALAAALGSSCPNCSVDFGEPSALLGHLELGAECLKMRRLHRPAIPHFEAEIEKRRKK